MATTAAARHRRVALAVVAVLVFPVLALPARAQVTTDRTGNERLAESRLFDRHNLARTSPGDYGQDGTPAAPPLLWAEDVAIAARAWTDAMAASGVQRLVPDLATRVCCAVTVHQNIASVAGIPVYYTVESAADRAVEMIMAAALPRARLMEASATQVGIGATIDANGKLWIAAFYRQADGTAPVGSPTYPHPLPEPPPPPSPPAPRPTPSPSPSPTPSPSPSPSPTPPPTPPGEEGPPLQDLSPACPPNVPRSRFTDVSRPASQEAVSCLVWWGIASGTSPTTFDPHREVRRDQMATFVARAIERSGGTLPQPGASVVPRRAGLGRSRPRDQPVGRGRRADRSRRPLPPGRVDLAR